VTDPPPTAREDQKDWTWVLERACPECGAHVGDLSIQQIVELNRECALRWAAILLRSDADWVRERPEPDVWSPLEYACHVRDVFALFEQRLASMVDVDDPLFTNWNPNETAEAQRYDLADPADVAGEMVECANALADRFAALDAGQLLRPGRRSDGACFTIQSFARYEIHDPLHHLWDVTGESVAGMIP
jgi:hypothetical protein